jgi:hypothetical protein
MMAAHDFFDLPAPVETVIGLRFGSAQPLKAVVRAGFVIGITRSSARDLADAVN